MGRKSFAAIHFNHGTPLADSYQNFVVGFCKTNRIPLTSYHLSAKANTEHEWAAERKEALFKIENCCLTAHHANDRLESMLMGRNLLWNIGNIWRPFIEVPKEEILDYAKRHSLKWIEDPTNKDSSHCRRNKIRNELIPLMRECGINPFGLKGASPDPETKT